MKIQGKNILITGGAGALGSAFTFDLASIGAQIMVCDHSSDAIEKVKQEVRQKKLPITAIQADVSKENNVEDLFRAFVDQYGKVDVVINNAGVAEDGLLIKKKGEHHEKFPLSRWQRGLDINLTGVFLCGREAAYYMSRQGTGGVIINISSLSRHGNFIQSNYSATKAAIVAMTVVWSKELSRYGIRSVALAPGFIDTPLTKKIPEGVRERIVSSLIPMERFGKIDEVSHAIRFIIENDYMNGRVIDLDGGLRI
ncbi:MAG: SDR family NAD(P)-dependent oxidoreductase [Thermodesulfobacteriota bacterium]|nr:SDR family NAD(P)-dependent oxidoreductase [Thermodesulfobacteriota bacterium]